LGFLTFTDKSKPGESLGRKAKGLKAQAHGCQLPKEGLIASPGERRPMSMNIGRLFFDR